jgi:hypothetical protein
VGRGDPRPQRRGRAQAAQAGPRGDGADLGRKVGQGGRDDRLAEADAAARVSGVAQEVGGGAYLLLAGPKPTNEQGLQKAVRERGGVRLRGDDTADGEAVGPCLKLSRQFLEEEFSEVRMHSCQDQV